MAEPARIEPKTTDDYLAVMTKAVFQSGMSWKVVEAKWDGFREVFHEFDAEQVAALSPADVDRIAQDTRVIRNRRKIEATVDNAVEMVELAKEHGTFKAYLDSHRGFEEMSADLRKRFRFLGETGAYFFLRVVGETVPDHEEWRRSHAKSTKRAKTT